MDFKNYSFSIIFKMSEKKSGRSRRRGAATNNKIYTQASKRPKLR